jgi:hypothetical protein
MGKNNGPAQEKYPASLIDFFKAIQEEAGKPFAASWEADGCPVQTGEPNGSENCWPRCHAHQDERTIKWPGAG